MKEKQGILTEIAIIIICIALVILMVNNDLDLYLFKIYSTSSLDAKKEELEKEQTNLDLKRTEHKTALKNLESAKSDFSKQKEKYEAISDATIASLKEATRGEEYNLEYMWIQLGNYAKANNLKISLYEKEETTSSDDKTKTESNTSASSSKESEDSILETLKIQVVGTYLNVSEFIFNIENDNTLRFKLDNIRMEYSEKNDIKAIFDIKGLSLNK